MIAGDIFRKYTKGGFYGFVKNKCVVNSGFIRPVKRDGRAKKIRKKRYVPVESMLCF